MDHRPAPLASNLSHAELCGADELDAAGDLALLALLALSALSVTSLRTALPRGHGAGGLLRQRPRGSAVGVPTPR